MVFSPSREVTLQRVFAIGALALKRNITSVVTIVGTLLISTLSVAPPVLAQTDRAVGRCEGGFGSITNLKISIQELIDACGIVLKRSPNSLGRGSTDANVEAFGRMMLARAAALMSARRFSEAILQYHAYIDFLNKHPTLARKARRDAQLPASHYWWAIGSYNLQLGIAYFLNGQLDRAVEMADAYDRLTCDGEGARSVEECKLPLDLQGRFPTAELRADIDMQRRQYARAKAYYEHLLKRSFRVEISDKLALATRMISQPEAPPPPVVPSSEACKMFPNLC
jgi:hypothetical protein